KLIDVNGKLSDSIASAGLLRSAHGKMVKPEIPRALNSLRQANTFLSEAAEAIGVHEIARCDQKLEECQKQIARAKNAIKYTQADTSVPGDGSK
ncbi:MAG TPA: hypothetical protein V6C72_18990, partial [Chroococcales cyanobacterium]